MKKFVSIAAAVVTALVMCISSFAAGTPVTVNFDDVHQTIDGFGASYTWYADWLTTNNNAETGYDWIFNDAGFNILRFRDLNHVGNEYQNALDGYPTYYGYYKAACDRGVEPLVLVTSWGQYDRDLPWVAFTEKSDSGYSYYTLAKDSNGEYMYDELADFCVESVKLFFDAGIPVDYFSISNEIELQEKHTDENGKAREEAGFFFGAQEDEYHCCYWKAHIAVYNAFKEAFGEYAPKLLGAETMAGWPDLLKSYIDPVIENCPESLEIVGHHLYGMEDYGGFEQKNFNAVRDAMSGMRIWVTEWYKNDYFKHAEVMLDELIHEDISAYLYWNGVWIADTGNCLIEIGGDSPDRDITRRGNHYIMTHFSKYIKRGYRRVEVTEELGSKIGAFISPDEGELVLIVMNPTQDYDDLTLDLGDRKILDSMSLCSTEGDNMFSHKYLKDSGKYEDGFEILPRSLYTIVLTLEPNPDYVEPTVEKKVNPFIKDPEKSSDSLVWVSLGTVAAAVVVAGAAVLIKKSVKKKAPKSDAEQA